MAALPDDVTRLFWDVTHTGHTLESLLEAYRRKYAQHDVGHVVRSLVYFGDAAAEPLPAGLSPGRWDDIQRDLRARVLAL